MDITATDFLKRATSAAEYFGFRSVDELKKLPACKDCSKKLPHTATAQARRNDALHGMLTCGVNTVCDAKLHEIEEPLLFYTIEQVPRSGEAAISFQIFNVEKSIAEAILIQVATALAGDIGYNNHSIRINSIGDRDSSVRYVR